MILVGDGVKQAKEARFMPGVKKLYQEFEDVSKARFIFGHLRGAVGVLMGHSGKIFCLPLFLNLQDGVKTLFSWTDDNERQDSHVVQMIDQGFAASKILGRVLFLLDRYFLSVPALCRLNQRNQEGAVRLDLVTQAKTSCVAYERPIQTGRRGRPRKKGASFKLKTLFVTQAESFRTVKIRLYDKEETVSYFCRKLLWGQGLYQELCFVLVTLGERQSILVSTDRTLDPEAIIQLYARRFTTETTFRTLKQPLGQVTEASDRKRILQTVMKAMEGYMMCSCIAMGLLQMIALRDSHRMPGLLFRYLRTPSKGGVSESTVMAYLRQTIIRLFARNPHLALTQIIQEKQEIPEADGELLIS